MSSIARVYVTRRAQSQIETAVRWWSQNRPSAPNAIIEELDKALEILTVQPNIGARAELAFWHSSRAPAREL